MRGGNPAFQECGGSGHVGTVQGRKVVRAAEVLFKDTDDARIAKGRF